MKSGEKAEEPEEKSREASEKRGGQNAERHLCNRIPR